MIYNVIMYKSDIIVNGIEMVMNDFNCNVYYFFSLIG